MAECLDTIRHIFNYVPQNQYRINKLHHKEYTNYIKQKVNIIIRFFKKIKIIKKLCKYQYLFANNRNFTKNTLIKFVMINYSYDVECGLPDIMVGSYNICTTLLDIIPEIYYRKAYHIYKFLKQESITSEMIINCWYSFY